jgi:hypothetical protein
LILGFGFRFLTAGDVSSLLPASKYEPWIGSLVRLENNTKEKEGGKIDSIHVACKFSF